MGRGRARGRTGGSAGLDPLSPSKGDFVDPCLGDLIPILKIPRWLKGLLAFLLKPLVRAQEQRAGGALGGSLWGSSPLALAASMASSSLHPPPRLFSSPHALQSSASHMLKEGLTWDLGEGTEGRDTGGLV